MADLRTELGFTSTGNVALGRADAAKAQGELDEAAPPVDHVEPAPDPSRFAQPKLQTVGRTRPEVSARHQVLQALEGGPFDLLASLSRLHRRELRALGEDAELRTAVAERFGLRSTGPELAHRPDRVMLDVVRRMDLPPDVAQRWLREAGVHAAHPGPISAGRAPGAPTERAMRILEDHAEVYRALRAHRAAERGVTGPGGTADPDALSRARRALEAARVSAGLERLEPIEEAEAQLLAGFVAHALRVAEAHLDRTARQLQAVDVRDPQLHDWLDALADEPMDDGALEDARAVMAERFPIVSAPGLDLAELARSTPSDRRRMLRATMERSAGAIAAYRSALRHDTRLVFVTPGLRQATLQALEAPESSVIADVVAEEAGRLARSENYARLGELAAGAALAAPSLGSSLVGQLGAVALSAWAVDRSVSEYRLARAALGASLEGALALEAYAGGDPSSLWVALDVATLVVDATVVAAGLRAVARATAAAGRGGPVSGIRAEVARLPEGALVDAERFAARLEQGALAAREDRRLRETAEDFLAQLEHVRPGLGQPAALGLARLSPGLAWALVDGLPPDLLRRAGLLARDPAARRGLSRLLAGGEALDTTEALLARRDLEGAARALARYGEAPEEAAHEIARAVRGPASARARRLLDAVRDHAPLDPRARLEASDAVDAPVTVDPALEGRSVEVRYASKGGRVGEVHVAVGPRASRQDVLQHAGVVKDLQRYRDLQGELRLTLARLKRRLGFAAHLPGSAGYEAAREVEKLESMLAKERSFGLDALPERLASLERQLEAQSERLARFPRSVGDLRIAASDAVTEARAVLSAHLPGLWSGLDYAIDGAEVVVKGKLRFDVVTLARLAKAEPNRLARARPTLEAFAMFAEGKLTGAQLARLDRAVQLMLADAPLGRDLLAPLPAEWQVAARRAASARKAALPKTKPLKWVNALPPGAALREVLGPLRARLDHDLSLEIVEDAHRLAKDAVELGPGHGPTLVRALGAAKSLPEVQEALLATRWRQARVRLATNTEVPLSMRVEAERRVRQLAAGGRVPPRDLVAVLDAMSRKRATNAALGHLEELRHAQAVLDGNKTLPGHSISLGPQNDLTKTVRLGPGDHVVFGGVGWPDEADVLFRATDGELELNEVKHCAHTLRTKVEQELKKNRDYLGQLQKFAKQKGQRAVIVIQDGKDFWEMMFTEVGGIPLGERLTDHSPDVSLLIHGQTIDGKKLRRIIDAMKAEFNASGSGANIVDFIAIHWSRFETWRAP